MEKLEAIEEFLKAFKKSFNFASLYSKDHPTFLKSIEDLKIATNALLAFLSPIAIGVSPSFLLIEGKEFEDKALGAALADILHGRKIKSVSIKPDVTSNELASFLYALSLRPKEIMRSGGINKMLLQEKITGLSAEELSYQQLLRGESQDAKDVWIYLLSEAVRERDAEKIQEVADNFERMTGQLKISDYLGDGQLEANMKEFLTYLKNNQREKFSACSRQIVKSVLRDRSFSDISSAGKIREFLEYLNEDDLAADILEQIAQSGSIDELNLKLFAHLFDSKQHERIAANMAQKLKKTLSPKDSPLLRKKIQELFSISDNPVISQIYRNALSSLLENISFEDKFVFDRNLLKANYRFLLLNLMLEEENPSKLGIICAQAGKVLDGAIKERDLGYIKSLNQTLKQIRTKKGIEKLQLKMTELAEDFIWNKEEGDVFSFLIDALSKSSKDIGFYLRKIFDEGKVNQHALKAFFKFFPQGSGAFYESINAKIKDLDFLNLLLEGLSAINEDWVLEVYKHIFAQVNELVKIEVLKAMQKSGLADVEFLLPLLASNSLEIKKNALLALTKNQEAVVLAFNRLLFIPSPFGLKNKVIMQNMSLIKDLSLKSAFGHLENLCAKKFFWNRPLRKEAKAILEEWNAGKG